MYKKILLPMAFDENMDIEGPLHVAQSLADKGAEVHLLHVFETPPAYAMQYVPQDMIDATRDGIKAEMASASSQVPNSVTHVVEGSSGRTIMDWAHNNGVDLIVMRSHRPVIGDVIWGSTAAFVVRHAKCAVHVIR